ncbi:AAA ATPase-like domain-containing protein [Desulfonema magnum]|uniref:AAA ATPase-like domain-containing protein n=2 Tax=Desulfonema magnum TaxID=45655 RepID=A0A975GPD6_9BACT|nr:AAA ATPase-like domain-containing protein [Desulfonema magnum]
MKINSFSFKNLNLGLVIEPIHFSNLSLLVGVSGVGKTIILQSLSDLKEIAKGKSLDGAEWEIQFSIKNKNYLWQGAFEQSGLADFSYGDFFEDEEKAEAVSRPKIIYEKLSLNDELLVERKENEIKLEGKKTPKLSSYKSALNLFNEEERIAPVFQGLNKIIRSDDYDTGGIPIFENFDRFVKKHPTLESIRNANIPTYLKLALVYKTQSDVFNIIKENFINIFSQVENIKLEPVKEGYLPFFIRNSPHLQIKEKNVSKWIFHNKISSGMFKTLLQISQLFLCTESTVILIDEFENSLGINCIDTLTENLLYDNRNIQFILTSHHPYIINAIGMEYWKVVFRKGGVISTKDAKDYNLGKSRHESFKQLIQLNDYRRGIRL